MYTCAYFSAGKARATPCTQGEVEAVRFQYELGERLGERLDKMDPQEEDSHKILVDVGIMSYLNNLMLIKMFS